MSAFRCAAAAADRLEPLVATASRVDRWLLLHLPGAWGPASLPWARLDPGARATVARAAAGAGARVVLIRRPAARPAPGRDGCEVFFVDSRPGRERTWRRSLAADAQLAGLRLPPQEPGWSATAEPLFLICTHGRHDPCCAIRGRPVAAALAAHRPQPTWECSHIGGDRFAANLVVLPAGLYFGRVTPAGVVPLVDALEAGRLPAAHLRGRSSLSPPAQAAQHFARATVGETGVDDLLPVREERLGDDRFRVTLAARPHDVVVTVRHVLEPDPQPLTCHVPQPKRVPAFRLVELR
jgi:hypothetical protein